MFFLDNGYVRLYKMLKCDYFEKDNVFKYYFEGQLVRNDEEEHDII